jgi:hypothetical protein
MTKSYTSVLARQTWTDDRLDDRFDHLEAEMDQRFKRVEAEMKAAFRSEREWARQARYRLHTDRTAICLKPVPTRLATDRKIGGEHLLPPPTPVFSITSLPAGSWSIPN